MMRSHDEWSATPPGRCARRTAAGVDRENRRRAAKTLACRRSSARRHSRAGSVAGDRRSRCRPHARSSWCRCAADLRARSAGDPVADDRYRPRQADDVRRSQERAGARCVLRDLLAQADIFSQGYRPRSLAALGFSAEEAASINPASSTSRCRPMAMPDRGRSGAVSTRWCRPRPVSIMPKAGPPASTGQRNCRRRCSITRRVT